MLTDWKRSDFTATRPDPLRRYAGNDMNSLVYARPDDWRGRRGAWSTYRTSFTPAAGWRSRVAWSSSPKSQGAPRPGWTG